jgi:hypothetical protein
VFGFVWLFGVAAVENRSRTRTPMFQKSETETKENRKNRHFGSVRLGSVFFGFGLIVPTPRQQKSPHCTGVSHCLSS